MNTFPTSAGWSNNPVFLWFIIGVMVVGLLFGGYSYWTKPSVDKVQKESNAWKAKYELIVKDYNQSKLTYNASLKASQAKYAKVKADYDKTKKEYLNVTKPKTSKERIDRLRALGYPPIIH
jgi:predicted negative regulator of RcsB-dependent stress response